MQRRTFLATGLAPLLAACVPAAMPGGADTLLGRAEAEPDLATFVAALKASGLDARLAGRGPFTVFAPTDAAFARLGRARVAGLMAPGRRAALVRLLEHHIGRGSFTPKMLAGQTLQIATLGGGSVVADGRNGLRIDRVRVTGKAIPAANGTIFKLTRVLGA
jgi:uncharacterized surface protein with fasciclin (FAS1) repeats